MSNLGRKLQRWTYSEITRLHKLYALGRTREEIAADLGMPEDRVRSRLQWEAKSGTVLLIRRKRRAAQRMATKEEQKSPRSFVELVTGPRPTTEAIRQRDFRLGLSHRDLTAALLNDPLPGFSALDRRGVEA